MFTEIVQVHQQRGIDFAPTHGQGTCAHAPTRPDRVAVPEEREACQLAVHASTTRAGGHRRLVFRLVDMGRWGTRSLWRENGHVLVAEEVLNPLALTLGLRTRISLTTR